MADDGTAFDAAVPASPFALPRWPHVPGSGSEPDWPALDVVKTTVPAVTREEDWAENAAYVYGFALMRAACHWEAHEVWEPVWLAAPPNSRARGLLRALIQTANAQLKLRMGRPRAVQRLAEEARHELAGLGVTDGVACMGVDVAQLRAVLAELAGVEAKAAGRNGTTTEIS